MTASVAAATLTTVGSRFRPSFYFWMTLAMCLFVFAGFGLHSFLPALQGNFPPAPPIVHLHGVVFVTWMLLLLTQSALVCSGNVKLHRALGTWGIAQGTATILIGLMMQLIASGRGYAAGRPAGTDGLYLGLLAFLGFALMFALAIGNRTRPDVHRRMILFAMLPVIPPGVNRFWANALGLDDPVPTFWLYLTLWSMAAAILLQERRTTGRIGALSLLGAGWIVAEGALHEAVVGSPGFERVAAAVLGLVHYR
ncbi:hypothetical protein [Altererythrobacter sp. Root672]|uniref:hypothetical protein n=1 Tax=Altererythrobacter sp. Root672 TaxID=1736584 RepID=UPI0006FC7AF9|nr:hypothetical protein [Altererythrobacter sp. Root672]KRA84309.1 hypothetical protein ASD76_10115 [Altererythrobacter sp. Root672]